MANEGVPAPYLTLQAQYQYGLLGVLEMFVAKDVPKLESANRTALTKNCCNFFPLVISTILMDESDMAGLKLRQLGLFSHQRELLRHWLRIRTEESGSE
jgi:hypothetical protein